MGGGAPLNSIGFTGAGPCPCPCITCVAEERGVGEPRLLPGLDDDGDGEVDEEEELLEGSWGPKIFSLAAL